MKRVVPIYPWPMHPVIAEALAEREDIMPVEALAGGPGPVVAIRKNPPFVFDAIVVERPERLSAAVDIAIADGLKMVTVRDMVEEAIGAPTIEHIEKITAGGRR